MTISCHRAVPGVHSHHSALCTWQTNGFKIAEMKTVTSACAETRVSHMHNGYEQTLCMEVLLLVHWATNSNDSSEMAKTSQVRVNTKKRGQAGSRKSVAGRATKGKL